MLHCWETEEEYHQINTLCMPKVFSYSYRGFLINHLNHSYTLCMFIRWLPLYESSCFFQTTMIVFEPKTFAMVVIRIWFYGAVCLLLDHSVEGTVFWKKFSNGRKKQNAVQLHTPCNYINHNLGHTHFRLGLDIRYAVVGRLQFFLELFGKGSKHVRINLQSDSRETKWSWTSSPYEISVVNNKYIINK